MRTIKNIMAVSLLLLAGTGINAAAQPSGNPPAARGERSATLTVEERASRSADRMKELLDLNDKQYKKVYKLYLKTAKKMEKEQESEQGRGPGGPGGMGPGGSGAPGGARPRPDADNSEMPQRPEAPDNANGEGGRPGGPGGQGMGPGMGQATPDSATMEKMDKKLRKILSESQYKLWQEENARRWR